MDVLLRIIKQIFKTKTRHFVLQFLFFAILVAPISVLGVKSYLETKEGLTKIIMERRNTVAHLAATMIEERFDRIIDVGKSFASRPLLRQAIKRGDWDGAMTYAVSAAELPFIDMVFLSDTTGTVFAYTPQGPDYTALIGKNYAHRDWYQGVSAKWEPYVSEVFKRAALPNYNVISVVIPITTEDNVPIGIFGFTVRVQAFLDWQEHIEAGPEGVVYFVDRKGQIVSHPNFSPEGDIIDFSSVPVVQKALRQEGGTEITFNPIENEERVSAYEPVHHYGWGVIAAQSTAIAFAERDASLRSILIIYIGIVVFALFATYFILRILHILHLLWKKEELIFESIGDGVVIIDQAWKITHFNAAAARLTGWTKEEAVGMPFRDIVRFIRENDRKENIVFIEEVFLFKQPKSMDDHVLLIDKHGKEIPVDDSAAPIMGEKGEATNVVIIFRDASRTRETQSLRSDFAYASHQLRTPVNKALWSLELALQEKKLRAVVENAKIAYMSLQSVRKLVSDLLDMSAIDQGTVMPHNTLVKLIDVVDEVMDGVRMAAKEKDISIIVSPISQTAAIYIDKGLAVKSIGEIMHNAIIHSSSKGEIKMEITPQENGTLIEIQDFGRGIPEEAQPLIFTRFFRGSNFDTTEVPGTGLGLFLSRAYITLLGGKIWFNSVEGKGTTFSVFLPENKAAEIKKN